MADEGAPDVSRAQSWRASSLWAASLAGDGYPTLEGDRSVDVAVIGAGITGMLVAVLAARDGASVLMLDRHDVGGVATRNTTAKISALQGTVYSEIRRHRGEEVASAYAAAQLHAVGGIRSLVSELEIDCGLTEAPAYTYASEPESAADARAEFDATRAAGLPVEWTTQTELPFPVEGAVTLAGQLHFDPGAFCRALAERLGASQVVERTAVQDVSEDGTGVTITTDGGHRVRAAHAVLATQSPFVDPALLANRCTPMQSYCIAARLAGAVPAGMYLSCDRSVRSLRPAAVAGETVAVIGGAGHHMGEEEAEPSRWETLTSWAVERFGGVDVTHRWATHDLVPTDHVPFIGRLAPGAQRRWVATGFAKWGMTNGYVAAHLITEAIGGRHVSWAGAFAATRIASTINRELVSAGKSAVKHLVGDRITRRDAPRCTHQGCVLTPDDALGTWDCPCHGSRFTADGQVVQGPANKPLELDA
jgi:glycine/D-amino acid oxidase-like deaminating enzyme